MYNNPFWSSWAAPYLAAPQFVPQQPMYSSPTVQQPAQQTVQTTPIQQSIQQVSTTSPTISSVWNWKVTDNYQSMLLESIPFDGTPVLFMMKNDSVFYVVSMVDGKKMINGFSFNPLGDSADTSEKVLTPEEQNEQRLLNLENSIANIMEQLNKLVEVKENEPNTKSSEKTKSTRQSSAQQQS